MSKKINVWWNPSKKKFYKQMFCDAETLYYEGFYPLYCGNEKEADGFIEYMKPNKEEIDISKHHIYKEEFEDFLLLQELDTTPVSLFNEGDQL